MIVCGVTITFFSPSLYLTVTTWPSTPATALSTVALVMVLPGCKSHGPNPSPVPRCESRKIWIAIAFWLPSACGMAGAPIYTPGLTSSSVAFTVAVSRTLSGITAVRVAPSRDLTVSTWPSIFSSVPRMRTRSGCWAMLALAIRATAKLAAPNMGRIILFITNPPGPRLHHNPLPPSLFPYGKTTTSAGLLCADKISLHQGAQVLRHLRAQVEPALESAHRLVQQHPETVDRAQPAAACVGEQRGRERRIDEVRDHRTGGQRCELDGEFRLTRHPERSRVDQQPALPQHTPAPP